MSKNVVKETVKKIIATVAPKFAESWEVERRERHIKKFEESMGLPQLGEKYIASYGLDVKRGPFRSLNYLNGVASGSVLIPKLIGSYEAELNESWESILANKYDTVIDVGCAEGYFAVGLARRLPGASVYAFDTNVGAQRLCQSLAEHNKVSNVTVQGMASHDELNRVMKGRSFILCDCDGCETYVLVPEAVPAMKKADLIVEVHDYLDASITPTLRERFAPSHEITYISSVEKDSHDYSELEIFNEDDRQKAINEFRSPQGWLVMRALVTAILLMAVGILPHMAGPLISPGMRFV